MSVNRFDTFDIKDLTTKAVVKEDGSISARSIITSIGVFPYKNSRGQIEYELREPSVVFDSAFIESTKKMPIYVKHQTNADGTLIKDQVKRDELAVGYTGEDPIGDNIFLATDINVTKKDGIDAINSGMRSFSVGYTCDLIKEDGVWCGMPYTRKQVNLHGDHLALVFSGRQGDQAVLRMDSEDAILCDDATVAVAKDNKPNKGEGMAENMKTVKIDSVDYQAEAPVIVALSQAQTKLDTAEENLKATVDAKSAVEAERDSFKERLDSAESKIVELEKTRLDEAVINARVNEKIALMETAKKAEVEVRADMADMDIRKAVVLKVFETAKLDGRDDVYVNARFDCAVEELTRREQEKADAAARVAGGAPAVKTDGAENSAEEARKRYLTRLYGAK
jgi:uncharacterized protein